MQRDWLTIMGFGPTHPPDLRLRRSSRAGHLWDALSHAHDTLGFAQAAGGDEVFRQLVLARIIEPASELDSLRVLDEVGDKPPSYATVKRRLPMFAETSWRQQVAAARAAHAGLGRPAWSCTTCRRCTWRPMPGTGSVSPGSPRNAALEPQITIGLLTDATGFPLMVNAFEGNKAETSMLPVIEAFMTAHHLTDVTVVADAGMVSAANQRASRPQGCRSSSGWHPRRSLRRRHVASRAPRPGHPGRARVHPAGPTSAATRSSTTSTGTTQPDAPCAASTNRSPRPRQPSLGKRPSSAIGSSSCPGHEERQPDAGGQGPGPGGPGGYVTNPDVSLRHLLRHVAAGQHVRRRRGGRRDSRRRRVLNAGSTFFDSSPDYGGGLARSGSLAMCARTSPPAPG
jgi:hypothetical protein